MTSQPRAGQSTSYGDMKSAYGGAGGWDRSGFAKGAPRSANRKGEEQHRHTERGSHTRRDEGEHSRQGGGAQQGRRGNQDRESEWRGWESVRMGGSDNKWDGLASQPRRYRVPGQPLLNRHQVGGVSHSPDGLVAQQEREPTRGRSAVRRKGTYGGRSGQRVEEQGTWASRTRKHSEVGYGRPVDRGAWTAKTVKRPRQQPAQPQYANYWAITQHFAHCDGRADGMTGGRPLKHPREAGDCIRALTCPGFWLQGFWGFFGDRVPIFGPQWAPPPVPTSPSRPRLPPCVVAPGVTQVP